MCKKELYVRKIYEKFIKSFRQLVPVFEPVSRTYFSYFNLRAKMNESFVKYNEEDSAVTF